MRARTGCPAQGAGPRPPVCRGNGAPKAQGEGRGRPVCPCWGHGATAFHGEELPNPSARHPAGVRSGLPRKQPPRPLCPETRPQDSSPGFAEPEADKAQSGRRTRQQHTEGDPGGPSDPEARRARRPAHGAHGAGAQGLRAGSAPPVPAPHPAHVHTQSHARTHVCRRGQRSACSA